MGKTKKRYIDTYDQVSIHRVCEYIGSFAINVIRSEERKKLVNERLKEFKKVKKGVPVVLQVATSGIKVFNENEQAIKMAHSIVRITFSTYSEDSRLFSYVANSSARQLSQLVSKSFNIVFAMAYEERKNNTDSFEAHATLVRRSSKEIRRVWAKKEIARGHVYAEHSINARKTHPLEMLPGPSHSDQDFLRNGDNGIPRKRCNAVCDYHRVHRQHSKTMDLSKRLVDGQMQTVTSNVAGTSSKKHSRVLPPINEIEPELSNDVLATDNCTDDQEAINDAQVVGDGDEEVFEDAVASIKDSEDDEMYAAEDDLKQGRLQLMPTDRAVLEDSYWYQPGLPRSIAEEMLQGAMPGTFFIRDSTSKPGFFALSMKVPYAVRESGIANILIERDSNGDFKMPGIRNAFQSLPMLVAYYASFGHELPVKLRLTYDEDPSTTGNNGSFSGVAASNDAPTTSAGPAASAKSPEEETTDILNAVLPNDPDFALYANCKPILDELNAQ